MNDFCLAKTVEMRQYADGKTTNTIQTNEQLKEKFANFPLEIVLLWATDRVADRVQVVFQGHVLPSTISNTGRAQPPMAVQYALELQHNAARLALQCPLDIVGECGG